MPREHQRTKNNPYLLPHNLYMQALYIIRDYDRLKGEYHAILEQRPAPRIESGYGRDGRVSAEYMPKGNEVSNPTEDKALRLAAISNRMRAVEQALLMVKPKYREGVMTNITDGGAHYPKDACAKTYRRWKQRFVFQVAKNMKYT